MIAAASIANSAISYAGPRAISSQLIGPLVRNVPRLRVDAASGKPQSLKPRRP
jgi:hypothetical protein